MRAKRKDANHNEIARGLMEIGASVADTSAVGNGFPDMVVGFRGRNWLLEVKDGSKPPSAQKLTLDQIEFKAGWRGHWAVVRDLAEAIEVVSRGPNVGAKPDTTARDQL